MWEDGPPGRGPETGDKTVVERKKTKEPGPAPVRKVMLSGEPQKGSWTAVETFTRKVFV